MVLIFTVTGSGNFQGCARMASAAEEGVRAPAARLLAT
jgi:hypothetical protein